MTDEELRRSIKAAVKEALEEQQDQMFIKIGRGIVEKALWVIGVGVAFLGYVIYNHGFPK